MKSVENFEKAMYQLNTDEVNQKLDESKSPEEAELWHVVLNAVLRHNQKKTIKEKFVR